MGRFQNFAWSLTRTLFGKPPWDDYWYQRVPYSDIASGVSDLTPLSSMRASAVFACVRILSDSIAQIPLHLYERVGANGKQRATKHDVYKTINWKPNTEQTHFEFMKLMQAWLCLYGNAYAYIDRTEGDVSLLPIHPGVVEPKRGDDGRIAYLIKVKSQPQPKPFPPENILHLRGLSEDGLTGMGPISTARQAVGMTIAAEEYGARLFANDGRPSGTLEVPGKLGKTREESIEVKKQIQRDWRLIAGSGKHEIAVLDAGVQFKAFTIPPDDCQFLETRQFQTHEIARLFGIPPHMIGATDKDTSWGSGIEEQGLGFVTHTLGPWLEAWSQSLDRALLGDQREKYFSEFMVDALVKGNLAARYQAYAIGRNWGWLSANDVRAKENMNPLPAGQGDTYMMPVNMAPLGSPQEKGGAGA